VAMRVNLDLMFLFDHAGDRIRLPSASPGW
jgi:hypothetical protein